jgi:hypothetical protein
MALLPMALLPMALLALLALLPIALLPMALLVLLPMALLPMALLVLLPMALLPMALLALLALLASAEPVSWTRNAANAPTRGKPTKMAKEAKKAGRRECGSRSFVSIVPRPTPSANPRTVGPKLRTVDQDCVRTDAPNVK